MTSPSPLRRWLLLPLAAMAWLSGQLVFSTSGLRLATADDVAVQRGLTDEIIATTNRLHDYRIGRVYADLKFDLLEWLMSRPGDLEHSGLRVFAFLLGTLAAAWFVWEWRRSTMAAAMVGLLGVGLMPVSIGYQALISLPNFWVGWAAVWSMGALALREDSTATRAGIAIAFGIALAACEGNAVFILWPFALWASRRPAPPARALLKRSAGCVIILVAYGLLSLALRHEAAPLFDGTMYRGAKLSWRGGDAIFALNAYTFSGLPGFSTAVPITGGLDASLWLPASDWWRRFPGATAGDLVGAGLLAAALWMSLGAKDVESSGPRPVTKTILGVLFFSAFAPNLLPSVTVKYQEWAHQRMWTYYYSGMSYLVWVVLLVVGISAALSSRYLARKEFWWKAVAVSGIALLAVNVWCANREAVALLRGRPFYHRSEWRELPDHR